jgi:hypothetical protein
MSYFSWFGLVFVAMLAATATVGLKTGSLWPMLPGITREEKPTAFWWAIGLCVAIVLLNIVNLIRTAFALG